MFISDFFKSVKRVARLAKVSAKVVNAGRAKSINNAAEAESASFAEMVAKMLRWAQSDNGIVTLLLAVAAVVLYMALGSNGGQEMLTASAIVVAGTAGGKHIAGAPLTTALAEQVSPGLLRNEIDDRIVKIRPTSTPIDQISRWGGARGCGSMVVDYYSVDTKATAATLSEGIDSEVVNADNPMAISTSNDRLFEQTETILVPEVAAKASDGTSNGSLVLYVVYSANDDGALRVIPVNNFNAQGSYVMPDLEEGTKLIRMGRAAGELDVQTAQFEALPHKATNFCQIFKAQVEQSTFQKIANKEVGWSFSDEEEVAIIDLRLAMEKNFLFGHKARITDPRKRSEVFLTGGIWNQTSRTFHYNAGSLDNATLVKLAREAFTNNAGSTRKLLIGGSGLIETLHNMNLQRTVGATEKVTCWGIDFTEIVTKFGTLYVLASEIFDECGHENDGFVIDPEYITKYSHVPFRTEKLDLRRSGTRNTDAIVITEASCLVLRYPNAHMRIVAQ